jgi:hypothetical protein
MPQRSLRVILFIICFTSGTAVQSQNFREYFRDAKIRIDTSEFSLNQNSVTFQNAEHLSFEYTDENSICEVLLFPQNAEEIDSLSLIPSGSYDLVDSLINYNNQYYRFKIEFPDLNLSNFNVFTFRIKMKDEEKPSIAELKLLPYHSTYVKLYPLSDELFIGEEVVIELITNNIDNVRFNNDWQVSDGINYRISKTFNQLQLHLVPNSVGLKTIKIPLSTKVPNALKYGLSVFNLPPVEYTFNIKQSRIQYLGIDKREVTLDDSSRRKGIEVQIENSRLLKLGKTYRIEDQEMPGGALIAELYTRNQLTNNKVLCQLRIYNFHRESEGYLFIKDNDEAIFITNFNITPQTRIDRLTILRNGNWVQNADIYPGEIIDLRIEGVGLHKARFTFEELIDITPDTSIRSENFALYKFKVPLDVTKNNLNLYNWSNNTGRTLNVREFQEPRPFDYISVNYDGQKHPLSELPFMIVVDKTIPDVIFSYDRFKIDSGDKLYGKQYLDIEVTITGGKGELIEMKTIENIVICPDINSPRYSHYDDRDCGADYFNLNRYLRKKTHTLDIWSRISIKVSNRSDKYSNEGFIREFDIILKKDYSFDIELSFPAGLLTVSKPNEGEEDQRLGQLTGISIAMIAQFSFYHPEKINTLRPFKVGAGFLALNAFNFSDTEVNRDVGLVILGSLYPTTKEHKLTFPLYFGGGYLLKDRKFFMLLGPGIRISF